MNVKNIILWCTETGKRICCGRKNKIILIISGIVWVLLATVLLNHTRLFGRTAHEDSIKGLITWFMIWGIGILGGIIWQFYCLYSSRSQQKKSITVLGLTGISVLAGTAMFWIQEWIFNIKFWEMDYQYVCFNIIIASGVFFIFSLLFNSINRALVFCGGFYYIWTLAGYYTYLFRGLPLQITDILDIRTAVSVAGTFDFILTYKMLVVGAILICLNICLCLDQKYVLAGTKKMKIGIRIIGAVSLLAGINFLGWSDNFEKAGINVDGNRPISGFYTYGTQLAFIEGARNSLIQKPEGYTVEAVEKEVEGIESYYGEGVKPNIIFVMNESFTDLNNLNEFPVSQEIIPNFNNIQENVIKGELMVSTYGGGTGKTEFEVLTGSSMHMYSSALSPYVILGKKLDVSLASNLKQQDYSTYAIHPYIASNYNREVTYAAMGFDHYLSQDDFDAPGHVRGWISDWSCYDKILKLIEEEENPLFTFCVTIQNHAGYDAEGYESVIKLPEYKSDEAEQFLTSVHDSDKALGELIERLEELDEPVLLVFFGDHLPGLSTDFYEYVNGKNNDELSFEEYQNYYVMPFMIWANYDIEAQSDIVTSANYLGSMALETAGVDMPVYNRYLLALREQIPAFSSFAYYGTDGVFHEYGDSVEIDELLEKAEYLQYNKIHVGKNRLDYIFNLENE